MAKMQFLPAVDLWNPAIARAVGNGQLRLQPGQWVRCGNEKLSRLVRVSSQGIIWATHPQPGQHAKWLSAVRSQQA